MVSAFDVFVTFIIVVKVCFILLAIAHAYLKSTHKENSPLDKKIVALKEKIEFVFVSLMAALLIYVFNPRYNHLSMLTYETKLLFYLFGAILLITAKWEDFFKMPNAFKEIQRIV